MNKMLIITGLVVAVVAAAAYMYMSGSVYKSPQVTVPVATDTSSAGSSSEISESEPVAAATDAGAAAGDISDEIASADALEVPDVQ